MDFAASSAATSAQLNRILSGCLVSDRSGNHLHTFHTVEFESDLYRGIMRARCYPFNMPRHQFHGKNAKVRHLRVLCCKSITYLICQAYYRLICKIYLKHSMYIPKIFMVYIVYRTVWPLSHHIRTTLATEVLVMTLFHPLLTQTACGLCAHSSSLHVLCAPHSQL